MKTIFITISRGSLVRNFLNTGVIVRLLEKGVRIVALVPGANERDVRDILERYAHPNLFFEPLIEGPSVRGTKFFIELFRAASFGPTVHLRWRYRMSGSPPSKFLYPLRILFLTPLGFLPGFKELLRRLHAAVNPQKEHDYIFKKYKPDLVFSTAAGNYEADNGVIKGAKRFGVRTVAMGKSWDNLSKQLFTTKADALIVWGGFMKRQAVRFQGYLPEEIHITGAPQFDFYAEKERLLPRDEFCRRLGLDAAKKIILYGSAGGNDCWDDAGYLDIIRSFIDNGFLKNVQVLIRPHLGGRDDRKRFERFAEYGDFVVDKTDEQTNIFKDRGDYYTEKHVNHLANSLYHADVCPNMVSTLTLDCLAVGTPVVNMTFDPSPDTPEQKSVRRLAELDYAKAVLDFGWIRKADSREEFLGALREILSLRDKETYRSEARKDMIQYFIHKNDGWSAERITEALLQSLNKDTNIPMITNDTDGYEF